VVVECNPPRKHGVHGHPWTAPNTSPSLSHRCFSRYAFDRGKESYSLKHLCTLWNMLRRGSLRFGSRCSYYAAMALQSPLQNPYTKFFFFLFFSLCLLQASEFLFTYGSLRHLIGVLGRGISPAPRPLPTQDNTTQRNTDTHPCPEQDSNLRSQC
jgi:hypothetical protein